MQDRVLEAFESGRGIPFFLHDLVEGGVVDSAQTVTAALFDSVLSPRRRIAARLEEGIDVLDAGCGRGSAARPSRSLGGAGLGTMWGGKTAEAMLREARFRSVERHVLPHEPMNVWFVARA